MFPVGTTDRKGVLELSLTKAALLVEEGRTGGRRMNDAEESIDSLPC